MSVTGSVTNNIRFPGQYYDEETGLHYNYYRDYNPLIGRYVEADPIGIEQGENHLYGYVGNNPVNSVDPMGLLGIFPPGFTNLRPDGPINSCTSPYQRCIKKAWEVKSTCTKYLWAAQAGCTALCAVACIASGPGYLTCVRTCAYGCYRGFAISRAGCWASYFAMLEVCRQKHQ